MRKNQISAEVCAEIVRLTKKGLSEREVAKRLGVRQSSIAGILRRYPIATAQQKQRIHSTDSRSTNASKTSSPK